MKTRYAISVGAEEEWNWHEGWPTTTPRVNNIQALLDFQDLCDKYHTAVTYFVTYAVLDNPDSRQVVLSLAERPNVEIGMQINPWNTPPIIDLHETDESTSFLTNLPSYLVRAKIEAACRQFSEIGLKPKSFRAGRCSTNREIQDILLSRGFVADASVVPFTTWRDEGAPDYRERDMTPRLIGNADQSGSQLWEIPQTLGFTRRPFRFWSKFYSFVERSVLQHFHLIGFAERLKLVRKVWLSLEDPLGKCPGKLLQVLRAANFPVVLFTLHSSSLIVGGNGHYSRDKVELESLLGHIDETLKSLSQSGDFQSETISSICNCLSATEKMVRENKSGTSHCFSAAFCDQANAPDNSARAAHTPKLSENL